MSTREQFPRHLRSALNHLYDPSHLRKSPLVGLFGVVDRFDAPSALQHILIEGIESMRPSAGVPTSSQAWSLYEVLLYRYVHQLTQQEVAEQMGFGERAVRRRQRAALEALAYQLWEHFDLENSPPGKGGEGAVERGALASPEIDEELAWLRDTPPATLVDVNQTLSIALERSRALADQREICVQVDTPEVLPPLAVHAVALGQLLLNLLSIAIHRASRTVHVSVQLLDREIEVRVRDARCIPGLQSTSNSDVASAKIAHQLAALCHCRLAISGGDESFCATLSLPVPAKVPVLAIDDNADVLQLMERYLADSPYRLVGTRHPGNALQLAQETAARAIVLDVMMPEIDGWEILARLRQHPLTGHIPIIICTILAQEDLAFSLGANAFIRKPITQETLIAALNDHAERRELERR